MVYDNPTHFSYISEGVVLTASSKQALPIEEVAILTQLQTESLPLLRARIRLLREAGWTLAQIGAPLTKTRSTIRLWQLAALDEHLDVAREQGDVPALVIKKISGVRTVQLYPDVPQARRQELHDLAAKARTVRGWMADADEAREAAHKLEQLLGEYRVLGVPYKRLAGYMGVTHRAVAARLERAAERTPKPYEISIDQAAERVA